MGIKKFSFRTDKPRWGLDMRNRYTIKYKGCEVGLFIEETFEIRLKQIKKDITSDFNPNCPWRWVKIKKSVALTSVEETKQWLNDNIDRMLALNLFMQK